MCPSCFTPGGKAEEEQINTITRCLYLGLCCSVSPSKLSTLTTQRERKPGASRQSVVPPGSAQPRTTARDGSTKQALVWVSSAPNLPQFTAPGHLTHQDRTLLSQQEHSEPLRHRHPTPASDTQLHLHRADLQWKRKK